jgi:hypothetical protein
MRKAALSAWMWSVSCDCWGVEFVWEVKGDRTAGEHHERECGLGGVKSVGSAGDQPDLVVERFGASVGATRRMRLIPRI